MTFFFKMVTSARRRRTRICTAHSRVSGAFRGSRGASNDPAADRHPGCTPRVSTRVSPVHTRSFRMFLPVSRVQKGYHPGVVSTLFRRSTGRRTLDPPLLHSKKTRVSSGFTREGSPTQGPRDLSDTRRVPGCAPRGPTRVFRSFSSVSSGFMT